MNKLINPTPSFIDAAHISFLSYVYFSFFSVSLVEYHIQNGKKCVRRLSHVFITKGSRFSYQMSLFNIFIIIPFDS